jgi:hypothetical protein
MDLNPPTSFREMMAPTLWLDAARVAPYTDSDP